MESWAFQLGLTACLVLVEELLAVEDLVEVTRASSFFGSQLGSSQEIYSTREERDYYCGMVIILGVIISLSLVVNWRNR